MAIRWPKSSKSGKKWWKRSKNQKRPKNTKSIFKKLSQDYVYFFGNHLFLGPIYETFFPVSCKHFWLKLVWGKCVQWNRKKERKREREQPPSLTIFAFPRENLICCNFSSAEGPCGLRCILSKYLTCLYFNLVSGWNKKIPISREREREAYVSHFLRFPMNCQPALQLALWKKERMKVKVWNRESFFMNFKGVMCNVYKWHVKCVMCKSDM